MSLSRDTVSEKVGNKYRMTLAICSRSYRIDRSHILRRAGDFEALHIRNIGGLLACPALFTNIMILRNSTPRCHTTFDPTKSRSSRYCMTCIHTREGDLTSCRLSPRQGKCAHGPPLTAQATRPVTITLPILLQNPSRK